MESMLIRRTKNLYIQIQQIQEEAGLNQFFLVLFKDGY